MYKFGKFLKKPEYLRQEMRRTYAEFQKDESSLMQVLDYIIRFNISFQVNNMFIFSTFLKTKGGELSENWFVSSVPTRASTRDQC